MGKKGVFSFPFLILRTRVREKMIGEGGGRHSSSFSLGRRNKKMELWEVVGSEAATRQHAGGGMEERTEALHHELPHKRTRS